jgi:hypothetical protein
MNQSGGGGAPRADVLAHLRRFLGPSPGRLAGAGAFEVHAFGPSHPRPWLTIATLGLCEIDLTPPDDDLDRRNQELLLYLPADWDITSTDPALRWPVQLLIDLAGHLAEKDRAPEPGESVALQWPAEPFAPDTLLSAALLNDAAREQRAHPEFDPLFVGVHAVRFLWVIPITTAENTLLLKDGYDALLQLMAEARLPYELDAGRACLVTGRMPRIATSAPASPDPPPAAAPSVPAATRRRRLFGR